MIVKLYIVKISAYNVSGISLSGAYSKHGCVSLLNCVMGLVVHIYDGERTKTICSVKY